MLLVKEGDGWVEAPGVKARTPEAAVEAAQEIADCEAVAAIPASSFHTFEKTTAWKRRAR